MVLSNWRGAICRGALLVLLLWAGLAWTQTPAQRPACDAAERFVYVHENGRKTRCRVLESWQLPDGRMAHLLEAVESKEKITIVDEPSGEPGSKGWAKQKRIFSWGMGRSTPPEGAPLPPHMRLESGIVINNDTPPPAGAMPRPGPLVVAQSVDDRKCADNLGSPTPGPIVIAQAQTGRTMSKIPTEIDPLPKESVQVIDFQNPPAGGQPSVVPAIGQGASGTGPMIVNQIPTGSNSSATNTGTPQDSASPKRASMFPRITAFLTKPFGSDQGCTSTPPLPGTTGNSPSVVQAGGRSQASRGRTDHHLLHRRRLSLSRRRLVCFPRKRSERFRRLPRSRRRSVCFPRKRALRQRRLSLSRRRLVCFPRKRALRQRRLSLSRRRSVCFPRKRVGRPRQLACRRRRSACFPRKRALCQRRSPRNRRRSACFPRKQVLHRRRLSLSRRRLVCFRHKRPGRRRRSACFPRKRALRQRRLLRNRRRSVWLPRKRAMRRRRLLPSRRRSVCFPRKRAMRRRR